MFVGKRNAIFTEYTGNIIFPCVFWKRSSCVFRLEKMSYFWQKEMSSFLIIKQRSYSGVVPLEGLPFRNIWRGIIFPCIFYQEDHFSFSVQGIRSYFRGKEMPSFLMIQERSYSSVILLERPSFQNIWKKKIWFFVQQQAWPKKSKFSV